MNENIKENFDTIIEGVLLKNGFSNFNTTSSLPSLREKITLVQDELILITVPKVCPFASTIMRLLPRWPLPYVGITITTRTTKTTKLVIDLFIVLTSI